MPLSPTLPFRSFSAKKPEEKAIPPHDTSLKARQEREDLAQQRSSELGSYKDMLVKAVDERKTYYDDSILTVDWCVIAVRDLFMQFHTKTISRLTFEGEVQAILACGFAEDFALKLKVAMVDSDKTEWQGRAFREQHWEKKRKQLRNWKTRVEDTLGDVEFDEQISCFRLK